MKFSIVTPNYNYGRFLKKALESVFAQADAPRAPQIEHIVIDGGSSDDSVQILKDWADYVAAQPAAKAGRYSFSYVSEPDKGQTDAINKGLRRATGDVVAWLNADEWYEPGALAKMAEAFKRHPKADLIHGEVRFVRPDGSTIRVKRDHRFSGFVLLWVGCYLSSAATFWRRRVLDAGDYLDASYKVCMDYEYWVRLWRHGFKFGFVPDTIASFTWHGGNVSAVFATRRAQERHKVQDLYCPPLLRTGAGYARFAKPLGMAARQYHRMLVLLRMLFQRPTKNPFPG